MGSGDWQCGDRAGARIALALHPMPGLAATTLLLIVIGLAGGSYGLLMAHARAFVPAHLTGRGVTLMNFFSIGGVGAMQFATGGVVTAYSVPGEPAIGLCGAVRVLRADGRAGAADLPLLARREAGSREALGPRLSRFLRSRWRG